MNRKRLLLMLAVGALLLLQFADCMCAMTPDGLGHGTLEPM
jgi:hypothetical protein